MTVGSACPGVLKPLGTQDSPWGDGGVTCECTDELRDGTSDLLLRKRLHILRLMPSDPATDNMAISESLTIISEWSHTNGFIESLV